MKKTTIMLQSISDVKQFVEIAMKYPFDIDLISGRYAIDGKSILGILSLDLSVPILLEAHTESPYAFFNDIRPFIFE